MTPLNILFLSRCYYPAVEYGGPIFTMRPLADALCQRGHNVSVWTTDLLKPGEKMPGAPFEREVDGAHVVYHRSGWCYRWEPTIPGFGRYCREHLRGFDAIHIFGYRDLLAPVACRYARLRSIPYVIEPLGSLLPQLRSFRKKWLYDHTLGPSVLDGARCLIATSEQERGDFIRLGTAPERAVVRANPINLDEFRNLPPRGSRRASLGIAPSACVVLFMGRLCAIKGMHRLVEAFSRIDAEHHLWLVGSPEDREYVQRLNRMIGRLNLGRRVHFLGPLYDDEKLQALVDADILVLPSDRENFGNAAAEAVACGIPVIVTDSCGIAPLVEGRAGIVVPPAVEPLGEALRSLTTDIVLRQRLADGCAQVRNDLSWEKPVEIQEQIYENMLLPRTTRLVNKEQGV